MLLPTVHAEGEAGKGCVLPSDTDTMDTLQYATLDQHVYIMLSTGEFVSNALDPPFKYALGETDTAEHALAFYLRYQLLPAESKAHRLQKSL
jgi:hypothetical protein